MKRRMRSNGARRKASSPPAPDPLTACSLQPTQPTTASSSSICEGPLAECSAAAVSLSAQHRSYLSLQGVQAAMRQPRPTRPGTGAETTCVPQDVL